MESTGGRSILRLRHLCEDNLCTALWRRSTPEDDRELLRKRLNIFYERTCPSIVCSCAFVCRMPAVLPLGISIRTFARSEQIAERTETARGLFRQLFCHGSLSASMSTPLQPLHSRKRVLLSWKPSFPPNSTNVPLSFFSASTTML